MLIDSFILLKVACAIVIVVTASRATERAGPFLGAMIATLPVSTGPIYAFLAIDHGAQFISDSALMGVAGTTATVAFVAAHAVVAQRFSTPVSVLVATTCWFATAFALALRATLVACVVVATTIAGNAIGPAATGVLATYPVVFTSLVLILQPRWGGPFVASLLVNALKGLVGFGIALGVLHLAAARVGSGWALVTALSVAVAWNVALTLLRTRRG